MEENRSTVVEELRTSGVMISVDLYIIAVTSVVFGYISSVGRAYEIIFFGKSNESGGEAFLSKGVSFQFEDIEACSFLNGLSNQPQSHSTNENRDVRVFLTQVFNERFKTREGRVKNHASDERVLTAVHN
jgi:hypothetical protein